MKVWSRVLVTAAVVAASWFGVPRGFAAGAPRIGAPAPEFTAADLQGHERRLSEFKGKFVVLEWHNQGCPFVKKHYNSGNMQRLQKDLTGQGVVWLTVISSALGKQGYVTPDEETKYLAEKQAAPTDVLLDPDGTLGHLYGAKTTPHMFVIDDHGVLVYDGAIDDKPTTDLADVDGARNYVRAAYEETKAGKPVSVATSAPYGCSVKYKE
jgi:peroxiredoxin